MIIHSCKPVRMIRIVVFVVVVVIVVVVGVRRLGGGLVCVVHAKEVECVLVGQRGRRRNVSGEGRADAKQTRFSKPAYVL